MNPILVVCPTRNRNVAFGRMLDSMLANSTMADVAAYVDEDQRDDYRAFMGSEIRLSVTVGPRVGPGPAMNAVIKDHPGYAVYGMTTDDSTFITPGWDEWILKTAYDFKGPGCLGPYLPGSGRLDFPYVTAEWIDALGWFWHPNCKHVYGDVLIEVLGDMIGRYKIAKPEEFTILHDDAPPEDLSAKVGHDGGVIASVIGIERHQLADKLRAKIK